MTRTIPFAFAVAMLILAQPHPAHAQFEWMEHTENPVFEPGPPGSWDAGAVFDALIIQVGDTLKMWYTGNDSPVDVDFAPQIGYASSLDGMQWHRRSAPIMSGRPGMWDSDGVASPSVILDGDTLRMWYVAIVSGRPSTGIGYATSVDGSTWTRHESPVLESGPAGTWDGSFLLSPRVIKQNGSYRMWYSAGSGTFPNPAIIQIGYATSADGINWTKHDDPTTTSGTGQFSDPVLPVGEPGSFDEVRAWVPSVRATEDGYQMWYTGEQTNPYKQSIGYATSPDGIQWTKHAGNPVLESSGSWNYEAAAASVIRDESGYRMWFTGFTQFPNVLGRIGLAASATGTSSSPDESIGPTAAFELHPPNPNPHRIGATIMYDLWQPGHVHLVIYNMLGQRVREIVNASQAGGRHVLTWDAKGDAGQRLAPGVFVVRMQMGGQTQTRTMLLAR
jgi:predicted GH43/DUF377 family glycosyl hydrolase